MFKFSSTLPVSEMKQGDNYKKFSDTLVKTISARYDFEKDKWSYTDGYSQLKYTDGVFILSDKAISKEDLSEQQALMISAVENGWSQNGRPNELDGESGYTIQDGEKIVNDTAAGKIIKNAKANFNVDLDKYYWKISDNGDLLMFVKKSDIPLDSEGKPDSSKKVRALQIKISSLKKEDIKVNILQ